MMIPQEGFYDGSFFTVVIYKAVGKTAGEVPEEHLDEDKKKILDF